jgi:hypothetical protein
MSIEQENNLCDFSDQDPDGFAMAVQRPKNVGELLKVIVSHLFHKQQVYKQTESLATNHYIPPAQTDT